MQKIEILGPGCARCKQTHRVIQHVVEEDGLRFDVVKEESLARMAALNVMSFFTGGGGVRVTPRRPTVPRLIVYRV